MKRTLLNNTSLNQGVVWAGAAVLAVGLASLPLKINPATYLPGLNAALAQAANPGIENALAHAASQAQEALERVAEKLEERKPKKKRRPTRTTTKTTTRTRVMAPSRSRRSRMPLLYRSME